MKDTLLHNLEGLKATFLQALSSASGEAALLEIKTEFLGKKGRLTEILKGMGKLGAEERPLVGAKVNEVKESFEAALDSALRAAKGQALDAELARDLFDPTLPGRPVPLGHIHPLTRIYTMARDLFERLGFVTHTGPEIEDEYHNFDALNIPAEHPARDVQDTFFLQGKKWLLRTHTSNVQIRVMEKQKPPLRMIAPGAVYRSDYDATHSPMFHQIEGLWVDEKVSFADLKGLLSLFIQGMFGAESKVRFRPSFFPFTEPSAELDMSCHVCQGQGGASPDLLGTRSKTQEFVEQKASPDLLGTRSKLTEFAEQKACNLCKGTGWIEILGCGMVDPAVFGFVGIDPEKYSGFAFGIGLERLAMLKFGVNDLRLFFENDVRFLRQF